MPMRRTIANLLMLVLAMGVGLPWLSAQVTSPACCRMNGPHHCSTPAHGDGFHAAASPCPYRKVLALHSQRTFSPATAQLGTVFAPCQGGPAALDFTSDLPQNLRRIPGRGPPLTS